MTRVLLDLNVVLDVFLDRPPWSTDAEAIWNGSRDSHLTAYFCSASFPTLFYVLRKQLGLPWAHLAVADCLNSLAIVPVSRTTLELAPSLPGSGFEDNLQIACAVEARFDAIVTRDPRGFTGSPVPAMAPKEFLARIARPPEA